ncbi:vacuolar fusion protein CCZ1 homolog B-like [Brassica rapa]|uniref:vacuolar fusion protein CCZ1 homolog B-like n=1 Tax=Brassica campestris TaxID=3711 RepID=UPI00142E2DD9|nr:vacuolar fusion protein CCZ1 homolog B-like [Brassica rapa]XP_033131702.1 vacuolar fusion protein CCZ1 homolog B-like [Brassica rapa]
MVIIDHFSLSCWVMYHIHETLFSPEAACEVKEAERHSDVFHEAEPDVWMVMIVEKNKEIEAIWRIDALHKVQKAYPIAFVSIITHCLNGTAAVHFSMD